MQATLEQKRLDAARPSYSTTATAPKSFMNCGTHRMENPSPLVMSAHLSTLEKQSVNQSERRRLAPVGYGRTTLNGFENLSGTVHGHVRIVSRARLSPLAWNAQCVRENGCGSRFVVPHARARDGVCPNSWCGRVLDTSPSLARVAEIPTATRSRDSESARNFVSQRQQRIEVPEPSLDAMRNADPGTLARYIDHQRGRR